MLGDEVTETDTNIRTDGKRLFFAQMEESGEDWAFTSLTPEQIAEAR